MFSLHVADILQRAVSPIDREQSLFLFRFSESNARARVRQSRERRLPSHAISHARGHLRVSRFPRWTTEKRETARSLFHPSSICIFAVFAMFLKQGCH